MTRIRIGFDGHHLGSPTTGNGIYSAGLIRALVANRRELGIDLTIYDSTNERSRSRRLLWDMPIGVIRDHIDVLHCQYLAALPSVVPVCLTIHDAAFAIRGSPEYSAVKSFAFRLSAARSAAIITVSEAARQDLARFAGIPESRVTVVPNGVSLMAPTDGARAKVHELCEGLPRPFVLYIGRMALRKRIRLLVDAFQMFRRELGGTLLLAGQLDDDPAIERLIAESEGIRWLASVSEEIKTVLLDECDVLAYMSAYEGFGLPVVEGMLAGIPVVASDIPALREITKGTVALVDAVPKLIALALVDAVRGGDLKMVEQARAVAATYTWDKCAAMTARVYENVAASR